MNVLYCAHSFSSSPSYLISYSMNNFLLSAPTYSLLVKTSPASSRDSPLRSAHRQLKRTSARPPHHTCLFLHWLTWSALPSTDL
ncbi:hypothetical protein BJX65DRAFT_271151 [Aspergillus insuetus]